MTADEKSAASIYSETKYKGIDQKTLFTALQAELNSRVIARVTINTAHLQTIIIFVAAFIAAKVAANSSTPLAAVTRYSYFITMIMPLISCYFVMLYKHNDMQIGLLNLCLRRIEEHSQDALAENIQFYKNNGCYEDSFRARTFSHGAVIGLCLFSPLLVVGDAGFETWWSTPPNAIWDSIPKLAKFTVVWTGSISVINVVILCLLQRYRNKLRNSK